MIGSNNITNSLYIYNLDSLARALIGHDKLYHFEAFRHQTAMSRRHYVQFKVSSNPKEMEIFHQCFKYAPLNLSDCIVL